MSTIRLMFINTFCCVEWNCSEPWHSAACFWGINVHARLCECVSWHGPVIQQSCHLLSEALSATISDWWLFKLLAAAGLTSDTQPKTPLQKQMHAKALNRVSPTSHQLFKKCYWTRMFGTGMNYVNTANIKLLIWKRRQNKLDLWRLLEISIKVKSLLYSYTENMMGLILVFRVAYSQRQGNPVLVCECDVGIFPCSLSLAGGLHLESQ